MTKQLDEFLAERKRVGMLIAAEDKAVLACYAIIEDLGHRDDQGLVVAMRALDGQHVDVILARGFGSAALALAIEDRLTKAAGRRVVEAH